ncbi:MAG: RidA family protein [Deltaproteobacteria bacterium]|nr:RidA family protein [Deltaproteobacteria bacterium]
MLERYYITPDNTYKVAGNNRILYTPVVVVKTGDHAHLYIAGRTARNSAGALEGKGDMRAQIRKVCENIRISLESVGATLADVTRTTTYVTDMKAYFEASDERLKFFSVPLPTSTTVVVAGLAMPEMLVEIEAEAIIEPERLRLPNL